MTCCATDWSGRAKWWRNSCLLKSKWSRPPWCGGHLGYSVHIIQFIWYQFVMEECSNQTVNCHVQINRPISLTFIKKWQHPFQTAAFLLHQLYFWASGCIVPSLLFGMVHQSKLYFAAECWSPWTTPIHCLEKCLLFIILCYSSTECMRVFFLNSYPWNQDITAYSHGLESLHQALPYKPWNSYAFQTVLQNIVTITYCHNSDNVYWQFPWEWKKLCSPISF